MTRVWNGKTARFMQAVFLLGGLCALAAADQQWKFDVLHLKNGNKLNGLVLEERNEEVHFRYIVRRPGSPTTFMTTVIPRKDVDRIERLEEADREVLIERLARLDQTGKQETQRMEALRLEEGRWPIKGTRTVLVHRAKYFHLTSNCTEDVVRRSAVRLDQLFSAFRDYLPPVSEKGKPVAIYLACSMKDYQELLKGRGINMLNPAFYDPARNEIVCASELDRLGQDLEKVRKEHKELLQKLREQEAELNKEFKNRIPPNVQKQLAQTRERIADANTANNRIFQDATKQLFETLYHEAFHAYLANYVYPPEENEVPRWLNEGLAQIFESAIVEAGEIRVGHADAERLQKIKGLLTDGKIMKLPDLLRSGPKNFVVGLSRDKETSDEFYLNAWGLAFYLTFDRKILGTRALDDYVKTLKRGTDPLEAFRTLTDERLSDFEKSYHAYLRSLKEDGTLTRPIKVQP